jgi:hypothetical protein
VLLLASLQASLIITAVYMMLKPKMIFGDFREKVLERIIKFKDKERTEYWRKPFFSCIICMASFWGLIVWLVFIGSIKDVITLEFWQYLLMTCGINTLISYFMAFDDE